MSAKDFFIDGTIKFINSQLPKLTGLKIQTNQEDTALIKVLSDTEGELPSGKRVKIVKQGKVGSVAPGIKMNSDTYLVTGPFNKYIQYDQPANKTFAFYTRFDDDFLLLPYLVLNKDSTTYDFPYQDIIDHFSLGSLGVNRLAFIDSTGRNIILLLKHVEQLTDPSFASPYFTEATFTETSITWYGLLLKNFTTAKPGPNQTNGTVSGTKQFFSFNLHGYQFGTSNFSYNGTATDGVNTYTFVRQENAVHLLPNYVPPAIRPDSEFYDFNVSGNTLNVSVVLTSLAYQLAMYQKNTDPSVGAILSSDGTSFFGPPSNYGTGQSKNYRTNFVTIAINLVNNTGLTTIISLDNVTPYTNAGQLSNFPQAPFNGLLAPYFDANLSAFEGIAAQYLFNNSVCFQIRSTSNSTADSYTFYSKTNLNSLDETFFDSTHINQFICNDQHMYQIDSSNFDVLITPANIKLINSTKALAGEFIANHGLKTIRIYTFDDQTNTWKTSRHLTFQGPDGITNFYNLDNSARCFTK